MYVELVVPWPRVFKKRIRTFRRWRKWQNHSGRASRSPWRPRAVTQSIELSHWWNDLRSGHWPWRSGWLWRIFSNDAKNEHLIIFNLSMLFEFIYFLYNALFWQFYSFKFIMVRLASVVAKKCTAKRPSTKAANTMHSYLVAIILNSSLYTVGLLIFYYD